MVESLVERHRNHASGADDTSRTKKGFFCLWRFKTFKAQFIIAIMTAKPSIQAPARSMKAELRTIGLKQDLDEVLMEWDGVASTLRQEFSEGKLAVQRYLDMSQFPFHDSSREMPQCDELRLEYNAACKGYEFKKAQSEDRSSDVYPRNSVSDTGSISWQTAKDADEFSLGCCLF